MLANVLKWLFIQYNRTSLRTKYFNGKLSVEGLSKPVTIITDKYGVPHIYADTEEDLFFAQGFIHARDRAWQMEMNRRVALGQVAEAFGEIALDTDRLVRTLGFNKLARKDYEIASDDTKNILTCYSKGVNAFFDIGTLPIEFKLSKIKPRKWDPIDSLAFGRVMAWTLSHGWSSALTRQEIVEKVGVDKAAELNIVYPETNPVELPDGIQFNELEMDKMMDSMKGPFLDRDMEGGGRGSNAWAISSNKSETGKPILCNDTHLVLSLPSIWYLNHLCSDSGFHVTGATMLGFPGIVIGHNEFSGWGVTLAFTDVEDIFVEKINLSNPSEYMYKDNYLNFEHHEEIIKVNGKSDYIENVRKSIHGPLIGNVVGKNDKVLSLCSKALEPMRVIDGLLKINKSNSWESFDKGVALIDAPALNFVYADIDSNISLFVSGKVPIRKRGYGSLPVSGWDGKHDWVDEIPIKHMPKTLNPSKGYIISCNNKIIDDDYPYFLGNLFMNGYRAKRIENIFNSHDKINFKICESLHMDCYSIPAKTFINGMIQGFRTVKPQIQEVIDLLLNWDCILDKDSIEASIYQVLMYNIIRNIVEDELGVELTNKYMGNGEHPLLLPTSELLGHTTPAIFKIFQNSDSKWIKSNKEIISLIENSIISTIQWLTNELGPDQKNWGWGKLHNVSFKHNMSVKKPLDTVFNLGSYEIGGDTDTVCQTAFNPSSPYKATEWSPAIRLIMDIGNWSNCKYICPPGQSGILGSKNYNNMVDTWLSGEYIPMLWERKDIDNNSNERLELGI